VGSPVVRVGQARDAAIGLQTVEQADERDRPDAETVGKNGLLDPLVPGEMNEDGASRPSHARISSLQLSFAAIAQYSGGFLQQPGRLIRISQAGIIFGRYRRWGGCNLQQKTADSGFVRMVTVHELLDDRLGQELVKARLAGWRSNQAWFHTARCPADHYSTTTV
jgi:hypothetical protein